MSDDNDQLTAEEQAALDAQRSAPVLEAPAQDAPEAPQAGADGQDPPEGTDPPASDDKRPQMVPHAALHQERTRRQEIERQAAEDRRKYEARFEELLKLVPQPAAPGPATAAEPAMPDFNADPAGYIVATMQRQDATIEQNNSALTELRQQQQQQQIIAAVQQQATAMEADYRAQNPGYDAAISYLRELRGRQLQATGITDPRHIAQQIATEAFQIAVTSLQQGGNPAERLHRMAEASGWTAGGQAAAPPAPVAAQQPGNGNGAPDAAARLLMAQQGQEHARGLGNVRGNGPSPMTAAKLLEMDDGEFLETMKKSKDARRLMGA